MTTTRQKSNLKNKLKLAAWLTLCLLFLLPERLPAQFSTAEDILTGGTLGGTRGMRLRRIGGATSYTSNEDFVYYPASSMKIIEHLYSMVLVEANTWNFMTGVTVITNGTNCSSLLNATVAAGNPQNQALSTVLQAMMVPSSNQATNAIQERLGLQYFPNVPPFSTNMAGYGRSILNAFIQGTLGMSNSGVNHKLGCGGPCTFSPANQLTLRDIESLYRAIATNTSVISPNGRVELKNLMLNESNSFVNDIIDQEAIATGKQAYVTDFRNKLYKIYKDGSYTCGGKTYRSSSGLIQLPTHGGTYKRLYTWGVFTHNSESWAYIPGTVRAATQELLRYPIRAALLTWGNNYAPADIIGEKVLTLQRLPEANGSGPAAYYLQLAINSLSAAQTQSLAGSAKDYPAAMVQIQSAFQNIETAQQYSTNNWDSIYIGLVGAAKELTIDANATMATIYDDSHKVKKPKEGDDELQQGNRYFDLGSYGKALDHYQLSVQIVAPEIDWNFRGPRMYDNSQGFVPSSTGRKSHGISQQSLNSLTVKAGPNPSQGVFHIQIGSLQAGNVRVEVLDLSGKILARVFDGATLADDQKDITFDGSHLSQGIYLLRVLNAEQQMIQKIMIQK